MTRSEYCFATPHGEPYFDDRRDLSGIILIIRNGLGWRDATKQYGSHKAIYNRWRRSSYSGIFAKIMAGLPAHHSETKKVMSEVT
ncbi:transposase [Roseovarius sp. S4756]|uniref:transposase n=1 Tax=Roseovarius maritimus TaxID=3342637 RepID=UPI003726F04E